MDTDHIENYNIALSVLSWTDKDKDPVIYRLAKSQEAVDNFIDVLLSDLLGLYLNEKLKLKGLISTLKDCGIKDISICRERNTKEIPSIEAYRLLASYLCLRKNMELMLNRVKNEDEAKKKSRQKTRECLLDKIREKFLEFEKLRPGCLWKGFQEECDKSFLWLGKYKARNECHCPQDFATLEGFLIDFLFAEPKQRTEKSSESKPKKRESQDYGNSDEQTKYNVGFIDYIKRYWMLMVVTVFGEIVQGLKFSEWWWLQILVTFAGFVWLNQDEENMLDEKPSFWNKYSGYLILVLPWLDKIGLLSTSLIQFVIITYPSVVILWNYNKNIHYEHESYPHWYPLIPILAVLVFPLWLEWRNFF